MKFSQEKKQAIIIYLLEKISQNDTAISKSVSDAFGINQNTVHTYINDLVKKGIINRIRYGQYEMTSTQYQYSLKRSKGELDTDTYAFDHCLSKHINHLAPNVQAIWGYSFSEMMNNVMDHSLAENVSLIIEQDYLNTSVIIADNGIGIFKKIKEHFNFSSLDEAICELFKGKLTTDSENHSGEGIFFSSKMMDEFFILSSGKIFSTNKYENIQIEDFAGIGENGTGVVMGLSNFTHKNPQEVFDLYANIDGGFTKTRKVATRLVCSDSLMIPTAP